MSGSKAVPILVVALLAIGAAVLLYAGFGKSGGEAFKEGNSSEERDVFAESGTADSVSDSSASSSGNAGVPSRDISDGDGNATDSGEVPGEETSGDETTAEAAPDSVDEAGPGDTDKPDSQPREFDPSDFLRPKNPETRCAVTGRVIDSYGNPIAGAEVTAMVHVPLQIDTGGGRMVGFGLGRDFEHETVETALDGTFRFEDVPADDTIFCKAAHEDYAEAVSAKLKGKENAELSVGDIAMSAGATVAGRVVDENGASVEGATVTARDLDNSGPFGMVMIEIGGLSLNSQGRRGEAVLTDSGGFFELLHIATGKKEIGARKEGMVKSSFETLDLEEGCIYTGIEIVLKKGGSVAGIVVDELGRPVKAARVNAFSFGMGGGFESSNGGAVTDEEGYFEVSGLTGETVQYNIFKEGFANVNGTARVGDTGVRIVIETIKKGYIAGRVLDSLTGDPVKKYTVQLAGDYQVLMPSGGFGESHSTFLTNNRLDFSAEDGRFRLEANPGTYTVEITAVGFAPRKISGIRVTSSQDNNLGIISMGAGATVAGFVLDAVTGDPVAGATVEVKKPSSGIDLFINMGGAPQGKINTGADGAFEIKGLTDGKIVLTATHANYAPGETGEILVSEGAPVSGFSVYMCVGGIIKGEVLDGENVPVRSGSVKAKNSKAYTKTAYVDSEGMFELDRLPPGEYAISYSPPSDDDGLGGIIVLQLFDEMLGNKTNYDIIVTDGATVIHSIYLPLKCTLTGFVFADGEPVPNAAVYFSRADEGDSVHFMPEATANTDGNGRYSVTLKEGPYDVRVVGGMKSFGTCEIDVPPLKSFAIDLILEADLAPPIPVEPEDPEKDPDEEE